MSTKSLECSQQSANHRYQSQNMRILKLIKSKMHPLQQSRTYKLRLPKIDRKTMEKFINSNEDEEKKYIEIAIDDEQNFIGLSTEIQQQHRYNIQTKRINYRLNSKKRTQNILQTLLKPHRLFSLDQQDQFSSIHQFQCRLLDEEPRKIVEISLPQEQILKQERKSKEYLNKIKQEIDASKKKFLNTINWSNIIGQKNDKQNYSIEYLVNKIQSNINKQQKTSTVTPVSAYESISPNKISQYVDILQTPQKFRLLTFEQNNKERGPTPESKGRSQIRKKTTMVPHEPDKELEHVSAKLRIRANHKRLIDANK